MRHKNAPLEQQQPMPINGEPYPEGDFGGSWFLHHTIISLRFVPSQNHSAKILLPNAYHGTPPDLAKSYLMLADQVVIFAARRSHVSPAAAAAAAAAVTHLPCHHHGAAAAISKACCSRRTCGQTA
jgi:hypothetical protein